MFRQNNSAPIEVNKESARRKKLLTGFTLLEVMISALLIMVGLGALGVTVVAGKRFLRQAEYRSQAMSLVSSKIGEFSAQGYSVLNDTTEFNQTGLYNWTASVVTRNATNGTRTIPYKDIEVIVSYPEEDGSGGLDIKNIRLTNIVPYPTAHTALMNITNSMGDEVPFAPPVGNDIPKNYETIRNTTGTQLMLNGTQLEFKVPKDIAVSYGVAVGIDTTNNATEVEAIDTIYTACFYGNSTSTAAIGVETRTPIKTQLSFNNIVVVKNVPARDDNKIEIKWYYDRPTQNKTTTDYEYTTGYANTRITLIDAELSILATEAE